MAFDPSVRKGDTAVQSLKRIGSEDRGAVGVIIAIFASIVMIGFAVIVVDLSAAYNEHRQIRNGADAAAVTIAQECSVVPAAASCSQRATALARRIADTNAVDGSTHIEQICVSEVAGVAGFPRCRTDNLAPLVPRPCVTSTPTPTRTPSASPCSPRSLLSSCPEFPRDFNPMNAKYLEVRVLTGTSGQPGVVAPLVGDRGSQARSCSRAAWGKPASLTSGLPITVSKCVVDRYRADKQDLAPPPPYVGSASAKWETLIRLHESGRGTECAGPAGKNGPGNFGWLDDGGAGKCAAFTEVNSRVGGDTGNAQPGTRGCTREYLDSLVGETLFLPVFDTVYGSGNNLEYRVIGYTAFHLTGWKLSGNLENVGSVVNPRACTGSDRCLYGMFTRGVVLASPIDSSPSPGFGASTIETIG